MDREKLEQLGSGAQGWYIEEAYKQIKLTSFLSKVVKPGFYGALRYEIRYPIASAEVTGLISSARTNSIQGSEKQKPF